MGHNRNLADYAHHFDGTHIDLGSGNIETQGVLTYEDVTNVDAIGIVTARAGVKIPDSQKIFLGTGDDIEIFHNGTDSFVRDVGTGSLYIDSTSGEVVLRVNDTENAVVCRQNAEVELYHNGSQKFETTTTGATVTGTLVSDGVTSELDLSAISSSISDTAVDVFVYDTRKDSDGGAWRKRTQHTSWYNETLNTSTRGSRKEFPAVAVIVVTAATTRKLYIYDGDDPDLPMWMVIDTIDGQWPQVESSSLHALNGIIALGSSSDSQPLYETRNRLDLYYFVSDKIESSGAGTGGSYYGTVDGLVNRRSHAANIGSPAGNSVYPLVNIRVNDVAMTVLPNAPIDDATGLPVPTIAVGTNDGVSFIKDDGTVMSTASSSGGYYIKKVDFTDDHGLNAHIDSNSGGNKGLVYVDNINKLNGLSYGTYANWDGVLYVNRYATNVLTYKTLGQGSAYPVSDFISMSGTDAAVGSNFTDGGLTLLAKNNESTGQGMVAFVTSDFNTGYQQGDIKGAFLSDTDTTNITSGEILSNGDFTNGTTGWTVQNTNEGSISVSNNQLTLNNSTSSDPPVACYQQISLEVGKYYNLTSVHVSGNIAVVNITTGTSDGGGTGGYGNVTYHDAAGTTRSVTFLATAATMYCYIRVNTNATGNTVMDSVSIRKAEEDRSLNSAFSRDKVSALTVNGTVTKSAVATGADLVGYGPFSDSNYLKQPYNSNLNFGTGAFSIMFWIKSATHSAYSRIMNRVTDVANKRVEFYSDSGTNLVFYTRDNASATSVAVGNGSLILDQWQCIVGTRESSGRMTIYIDGDKKSTVAGTPIRDLTSSTAELIIGNGGNWDAGNPFPGQLSLIRISATVPSPEQIKKMYEDEKVLFQENAKATLYGSSDAVTALAYDEDTELLHVGTSAGRSDFQGLRRINNTTTAVTTAISASDDLIAEQ